MSKLLRLLLCLAFVSMFSMVTLTAHTAFAKPKEEKQENKEELVYATKRGKKYHKEGCRFIKDRETVSMSIEEAKEKGLKPCGRCIEEETQDKK